MKRWIHASQSIEAARKIDFSRDDLDWINGLNWSQDWHNFTITRIDPQLKTCEITEEWIAEDSGRECKDAQLYWIRTDENGYLMFVNKKHPDYKFYANSAYNYRDLVPKEIDELAFLDEDGDEYYAEDYEHYDEDDEYTPSATRGDYSPSNPWDAPGMSIRDFI